MEREGIPHIEELGKKKETPGETPPEVLNELSKLRPEEVSSQIDALLDERSTVAASSDPESQERIAGIDERLSRLRTMREADKKMRQWERVGGVPSEHPKGPQPRHRDMVGTPSQMPQEQGWKRVTESEWRDPSGRLISQHEMEAARWEEEARERWRKDALRVIRSHMESMKTKIWFIERDFRHLPPKVRETLPADELEVFQAIQKASLSTTDALEEQYGRSSPEELHAEVEALERKIDMLKDFGIRVEALNKQHKKPWEFWK